MSKPDPIDAMYCDLKQRLKRVIADIDVIRAGDRSMQRRHLVADQLYETLSVVHAINEECRKPPAPPPEKKSRALPMPRNRQLPAPPVESFFQ